MNRQESMPPISSGLNTSSARYAKATLPLFLIGVSRSGTSFLQRLLNTHPQVRLSYESKIPYEGWHCYRRRHDLMDRSQFDAFLDELIACDRNEIQNRWMGEAIDRHRTSLFDRHREAGSFSQLIENIYQSPGPVCCWGNKMLRIEMSCQLVARFPKARFIVLVRDPRAVVVSRRKKFVHQRTRYSAIYWDLHASWAIQKGAEPERYLVVRYEDLVRNPAQFLEQILRFAGIWDADISRRMLDACAPHTDSLDTWRAVLGKREIRLVEGICFDAMRHFGYVPEIAHGQKRLTMLTKAAETLLANRHRIPFRPEVWRRKGLLRRFWTTIRN